MVKQEWKITVHFSEQDLFFYVNFFQQREGRLLFIDKKTGLAKNYPLERCSIEEVR